jgi:hypothetical protein
MLGCFLEAHTFVFGRRKVLRCRILAARLLFLIYRAL